MHGVVSERLDPRLIRRAEVLVTAAVEDERSRGVRLTSELRRKPRLADARLPGEESNPALPLGCVTPGRCQALALDRPADERPLP